MSNTFECSLVTPEEAVFDQPVTSANLPAHDGQLGILANHAPLLVQLGEGDLHLKLEDGSSKSYKLRGGFAQMNNNKLTLLSESAEPAA